MVTISVGFEPGAIDDFKQEAEGVQELFEREQITESEAERWAEEAGVDLADKAKIDFK